VLLLVALAGCEEESDLAIKRVVSPVVIEVESISSVQLKATVFELDKSGILDYTVGIDSIAVPELALEVYSGTISLGLYTTDGDGSILVDYVDAKPTEYAGTYKGIAFRIKK
jgi:hypothetical protein